MSHRRILILTAEPLAGALLGAAVELADAAPHFPAEHETPRAALRRVRPAVVLVDCAYEDACTESFIGPALMTDARVLLFRPAGAPNETEQRMKLRAVEMPADVASLTQLLNELLG